MSYMALTGYSGGCCGGFGASIDFNADAVWSDCLAGSAGNNAAGKRCGQAIQAALNQLGYGPLTVDGQIGPATIAAIKRFAADNGFGNATWPTKPMLIKMQELLAAGEKPGPGAAVESHIVGGEVIPGSAPGTGVSKAGMGIGLALGIGAVALVGIGAIAIMSKKKGASKSTSTSITKS
jgi:peptidoglycan hydrolase-like protein with peptidoglycan-binding domain